MEGQTVELQTKVRAAVKAKLIEMSAYEDDELPDYIMVMVTNKRTQVQMTEDLRLFLGSKTELFTVWLHQILLKINDFTKATGTKRSGSPQSSDSESANRKKIGNEFHRSHVKKKDKKHRTKERKSSSTDRIKNRKNSDLPTSIIAKPEITTTTTLSKSKVILMNSDDDEEDFINIKADAEAEALLKAELPSGHNSVSQKPVEKSATISHFHKELPNKKHQLSEQNFSSSNVPNSSPGVPIATSVASTTKSAPIKSTCVKPQLNEKTKNVVTLPPIQQPVVTTNTEILSTNKTFNDPKKQNVRNISTDVKIYDRLGPFIRKPVMESNTSKETGRVVLGVKRPVIGSNTEHNKPNTSTLSERFSTGVKRLGSITERLGTPAKRTCDTSRSSSWLSRSPTNAKPVRVTDRLGIRQRLVGTTSTHKFPNKINYSATNNVKLKITDRLGSSVRKPVSAVKSLSDSGDRLRIKSNAPENSNIQSRLGSKVALTKIQRADSTTDQEPRKPSLQSQVVVSAQENDDEDLHTSVASVVRVKPRPRIPAALQANKALILKAMAEAQKSVASATRRQSPPPAVAPSSQEKVTGTLFSKSFQNMDKIAITLSNPMYQPENSEKEPSSLSERSVLSPSINSNNMTSISRSPLQKNITVQVSSSGNMEDNAENFVTEYDELPDDTLVQAREFGESTEVPTDGGAGETETEMECEYEEEHLIIDDEQFEYDDEFRCDEIEPEEEEEENGESVRPSVVSTPYMDSVEAVQQNSRFVGNPQFVVTLDGLNAITFNEDENYDDDCNDSKVSSESYQTITTSSDSKSIQPPNFVLEVKPMPLEPLSNYSDINAISADVSTNTENTVGSKSLDRCKYYPNCRMGDNCIYQHLPQSCKTFPNCKFGDKCMFTHPKCKFDAACTKKDCPYKHASNRKFILSGASKLSSMNSQVICKFFPKCSNLSCRFLHPKPCRYGRYCVKTGCNFLHNGVPTADKLKWVCPLRS